MQIRTETSGGYSMGPVHLHNTIYSNPDNMAFAGRGYGCGYNKNTAYSGDQMIRRICL